MNLSDCLAILRAVGYILAEGSLFLAVIWRGGTLVKFYLNKLAGLNSFHDFGVGE